MGYEAPGDTKLLCGGVACGCLTRCCNGVGLFVCLFVTRVQEIANSYVDQQQGARERGDEKAREERRLEKRKAETASIRGLSAVQRLLTHHDVQTVCDFSY